MNRDDLTFIQGGKEGAADAPPPVPPAVEYRPNIHQVFADIQLAVQSAGGCLGQGRFEAAALSFEEAARLARTAETASVSGGAA